MEIVVVGGGIAGLSAALELSAQPGVGVTVLEADAAFGGKLQSARLETPLGAAVVDAAAESFVTRKPEALHLVEELGLQGELLEPGSELRGVSLVRDGKIRAVPTSPPAFLRPNALGAAGALRLLREPFIAGATPPGDESLHGFLTRRLGARAAAVFGPVMAGIYGADPHSQSLQASFPVLRELEREHGSLVRGMLRVRRGAPKPVRRVPRAIALRGGVRQLIAALEARLRARGVDLRANASVRALEPGINGHRLRLASGEVVHADAVILAVPAVHAARLLRLIAPQAADRLETVRHTGIGTLALAVPAQALHRHAARRGVMVPRGEGSAMDAVLFTGFKMPERVTDGLGLIRVFFGANRPALLTMRDEDLLEVVRQELHTLLGIDAQPLEHAVWRWHDFPLLEVGHLERVAAIEAALPAGVFVAGASYRGVGVPDCIRQGRAAARAAVQQPAQRPLEAVLA
jgi:oxygen-dependent protoporphyrinogen oxidase